MEYSVHTYVTCTADEHNYSCLFERMTKSYEYPHKVLLLFVKKCGWSFIIPVYAKNTLKEVYKNVKYELDQTEEDPLKLYCNETLIKESDETIHNFLLSVGTTPHFPLPYPTVYRILLDDY